ncbi:DDE-type integrase/transposase/recombinase [Sphingomicrobium aquimarinum]|uniref:DDE-type integrase/transposase/recombinase n=1 Tax=Sphingomicrobium aquimarinum TaxID=3133971 RepID=UPI003D731923
MTDAVDDEGKILGNDVTVARDKKAALRFLKEALKRHGRPESIRFNLEAGLRRVFVSRLQARPGQLSAKPETAASS